LSATSGTKKKFSNYGTRLEQLQNGGKAYPKTAKLPGQRQFEID